MCFAKRIFEYSCWQLERNLFFVIAKIVVFLTTQPVCPFFDANVGHAIEEVTFMQS
jgi:hypothetical protein